MRQARLYRSRCATIVDFKILTGVRQSAELLRVLLRDDDSHSLLRLGDRELGAVKTLIFLRNSFERSISSPSASSPIATETPPAPKSLQRLISRRDLLVPEQSLRASLSSGGLPFWTSAPQVVREDAVCAFEEPVAPPQPSRPVRPPSRIINRRRESGARARRSSREPRRRQRRSPGASRHNPDDRAHKQRR